MQHLTSGKYEEIGLFANTGGYKPLLLPDKGEDLIPGRQYAITPLARLILREVYCLAGVPTICECIRADRRATRITTVEEDIATGVAKPARIAVIDAQTNSFSTYIGNKEFTQFTLDLPKMEELAEFYDKSHKLPGNPDKNCSAKIAELEADWFKHSKQHPQGVKFRGQSLRWWSRDESQKGCAARLSGSRSAEKLDLSILDI